MAISPFSARPAPPGGERRRARLAVAIATVGIGTILLAYAISPGVRHAVSHAAHSVKHAVGHVFSHGHAGHRAHHPHPRVHLAHPLVPGKGGPLGAGPSHTRHAGTGASTGASAPTHTGG